jgi:hypothetical protein
VQKSLQTKGLIVPLSISIGRGRTKILSPTDKGKAILGISEPDADRLGGPEHRYWKKRIAEHLRASGCEVVEEYPIGGGQAIDLVAARDGRRVAIEVETGKSDAAGNVAKCLRAGMEQVLVVATSQPVRTRLLADLPNDPRVVCLTGPDAAGGLGTKTAYKGLSAYQRYYRTVSACPRSFPVGFSR